MVSRSATPAKAATGMLSAMRMPASERRTTTRSRCSSTCRTRPSAAASLAENRTGRANGSSRNARPDPAGIRHFAFDASNSPAPGLFARSLRQIMAERRRNPLNVRG